MLRRLGALGLPLLLLVPSTGRAQESNVPDWLRDYANTTGLAGPAPGEPGGSRSTQPAPAPARPEPSPYDTNWFTDADELPAPPGARADLDRALRPDASASDLRALDWLDLNGATSLEKARLVERALALDEGAWVASLFAHYRPQPNAPFQFSDRGPDGVVRPRAKEGARTLEHLVRRGALLRLCAGLPEGALNLLAEHVDAAATARPLIQALLAQDTRPRRLAAHRVFDRVRALGCLAAVLTELRGSTNETVRQVAAQANPSRRPDVIGHRADPVALAENTLPAIRSAAERGADGVEIDLCVTKDGRIVLWHDATPGDVVSVIRNLGLEGGMGYRPTWPPVGSAHRRPVADLTLAEVRAHLGYARKDDQLERGSNFRIPTLDEAAACLAGLPSLRTIVLDIKLPGDQPALHARFANALGPILAQHGLRSRVVLMTIEASVVRNLKKILGDDLAYTHDQEITNAVLPGGGHSAVKAAQALGNRVCSIGRPRVPKLGGEYSYFLDVLRADRTRIDEGKLGLRFLTWTLNDELELREVIAIGVDGIVTDDPSLLLRVLKRLKL